MTSSPRRPSTSGIKVRSSSTAKRNFTLVAAATFVALYIGRNYDIFRRTDNWLVRSTSLEVDELFGVIAVLVVGLTWAIQRLLRDKLEAGLRQAAEREIRSLAYQDTLTGLSNRRQFEDALKMAGETAPRLGACHALFLLDLNSFKHVNDTAGHAAGDQLLIQVAARFSAALREGDLLARLGGDEFGVLGTHLNGPEAATSLGLRLIEQLEQPIRVNGRDHKVGVSIGIALCPLNGVSAEHLLRRADIALYRAKEEGRSTLCFFEAEMDARIRERDILEQELRVAVATHAIRPIYQPLVDLATGRIRAFEALARWTSPTLGPIEPGRFIPIAEAVDLIGPLTESLLRCACMDALGWPEDVRLAFNLSPTILNDERVVGRILGILAAAGFPPSRLELEITESALVRNMASAQKILGALRQSGMRIALDDFGTGYSSLYHLRNFKVDTIKIDRSFIEWLVSDRDSKEIVQALIGLGAGLGLEVTAEGVESEEQRKILLGYGCDQAQGYLYSRGLSALESVLFLRHGQVDRIEDTAQLPNPQARRD
ncbi:bifunctional diguanylate cyclase/phosphodiesterase [Acidipila sp. EB88]|uniref:putative bifunctional diguanylate cyclase/phosphodiesterase n=1 Tax=Acidipila sp. EB88 TaxID=2305226 RepID=UPI000F5E1129|nr:EAL domain-containing protein [Acidipila sp. EB88]RRA49374.1 EAL domain-containing protein [Acidipila sp. EB88]